jgi:hypothetical protein
LPFLFVLKYFLLALAFNVMKKIRKNKRRREKREEKAKE